PAQRSGPAVVRRNVGGNRLRQRGNRHDRAEHRQRDVDTDHRDDVVVRGRHAEAGTNKIYARATDTSGNKHVTVITVIANNPDRGPGVVPGLIDPTLPVLLVFAGISALVGTHAFLWNRSRTSRAARKKHSASVRRPETGIAIGGSSPPERPSDADRSTGAFGRGLPARGHPIPTGTAGAPSRIGAARRGGALGAAPPL